MGGGVFSKDCCLQLASHNGLRTFHLLRAVLFLYFKHQPAKLYFAANTHWVTNTLFPFVEENVLFIAKNIFQTKYRSQRVFPKAVAVFSFCLSQTFITHVVIDIFIINFFLLCNFYGHGLVVLRQWGLRFRNIHLCVQKGTCGKPSWANGAFFCEHGQDQRVILKRTHFAVPPLRTQCQIKIILTFYFTV